MKKLWFLPLIVTLLYNSCTKDKATDGIWEIEITLDGVTHHWKGKEEFPGPAEGNLCILEPFPTDSNQLVIVGIGFKSNGRRERLSGGENITLLQYWDNNGGGLTNANHIRTLFGADDNTYSFTNELQVELLDEGTPPDYNNSSWGRPMIVNIPPQTVMDINWGGNHTISGKITALRTL